jgi:hypothetical protein
MFDEPEWRIDYTIDFISSIVDGPSASSWIVPGTLSND